MNWKSIRNLHMWTHVRISHRYVWYICTVIESGILFMATKSNGRLLIEEIRKWKYITVTRINTHSYTNTHTEKHTRLFAHSSRSSSSSHFVSLCIGLNLELMSQKMSVNFKLFPFIVVPIFVFGLLVRFRCCCLCFTYAEKRNVWTKWIEWRATTMQWIL